MAEFDFDSEIFKNHIRLFAHRYSKKVRSEIVNSPYFKILFNYLNRFWEDRGNKKDMFSIYIDLNDFEKLELAVIVKNIDEVVTPELKTKNLIKINHRFEIIRSDWNSLKSVEARRYYSEISEDNKCLFFFGEVGIDVYINGVHEIITNTFYSPEDIARYSVKYHISEIDKVFKVYQDTVLSQQHVYSYFFAEKSNVKRIDEKLISANILRNKPEKLMRDHLRHFLNEKVKGTFSNETELISSKRRLDIHTEIEGQYYFFEIKWLGQCISDNGQSINDPYKNANERAKGGVKQTLEYIAELIEVMEFNLKTGYLIIFDARKVKDPIDYDNMSFLDEKHKPYLSNFEKIDGLILDNKHPA